MAIRKPRRKSSHFFLEVAFVYPPLAFRRHCIRVRLDPATSHPSVASSWSIVTFKITRPPRELSSSLFHNGHGTCSPVVVSGPRVSVILRVLAHSQTCPIIIVSSSHGASREIRTISNRVLRREADSDREVSRYLQFLGSFNSEQPREPTRCNLSVFEPGHVMG